MPTFLNQGNYMKMSQMGPGHIMSSNPMGPMVQHPQQMMDQLPCQQVFHHIQGCPVCQRIFPVPPTAQEGQNNMGFTISLKDVATSPIMTVVLAVALIITILFLIRK